MNFKDLLSLIETNEIHFSDVYFTAFKILTNIKVGWLYCNLTAFSFQKGSTIRTMPKYTVQRYLFSNMHNYSCCPSHWCIILSSCPLCIPSAKFQITLLVSLIDWPFLLLDRITALFAPIKREVYQHATSRISWKKTSFV